MWQCSIFSCMFTFSSCRVHPFMFILWSHIVHKKLTWFLMVFTFCSCIVHLVFTQCSLCVHGLLQISTTFHLWLKLFLNLQVVYFSEIFCFFPHFSPKVNKSWTQNEQHVNTKWTMFEQNLNTVQSFSEYHVNNVWTKNEHQMNIGCEHSMNKKVI